MECYMEASVDDGQWLNVSCLALYRSNRLINRLNKVCKYKQVSALMAGDSAHLSTLLAAFLGVVYSTGLCDPDLSSEVEGRRRFRLKRTSVAFSKYLLKPEKQKMKPQLHTV